MIVFSIATSRGLSARPLDPFGHPPMFLYLNWKILFAEHVNSKPASPPSAGIFFCLTASIRPCYDGIAAVLLFFAEEKL
jgi:hypothetical protein